MVVHRSLQLFPETITFSLRPQAFDFDSDRSLETKFIDWSTVLNVNQDLIKQNVCSSFVAQPVRSGSLTGHVRFRIRVQSSFKLRRQLDRHKPGTSGD